MSDYFFIPTNSLNFNNILSSESISPCAFYSHRGYGFRRFEQVRANSFKNSLLVYDAIPLFDFMQSDQEEFPLYLGVPKRLLPEPIQTFNHSSYSILQLDSPVYLNWKHCFFVVSDKEDKRKLQATPERSLEVKHTEHYLSKIKVLSELHVKTFNWDDAIISPDSDIKSINPEHLNTDQRLNKIKGFLYGWMCGSLRENLPEMSLARRHFQKFVNTLSGVMNELSVLTRKSNKTNSNNAFLERELIELKELKYKIGTLFYVDEEEKVSNMLKEAFGIDDNLVEHFRSIRYKNGEVTIYSILTSFLKQENPSLRAIDDLLSQLIYQVENFLIYRSPKSYHELEGNFNLARQKVKQMIESLEKQSIASSKVDQVPFTINETYDSVEPLIKGLSRSENQAFKVIVEELLGRVDLSSSDEIAQQRQDIITEIANKIKGTLGSANAEGKDFPGRDYLVKLFKSLKTVGIGFNPSDTDNNALQALAYFLSRYSDMSKFQNFMEKDGFQKFGLGYAIWGAAYGYANLSKVVLEPLKANLDALHLINDFIHCLTYGIDTSSVKEEPSDDSLKESIKADNTVEWEVDQKPDAKSDGVDRSTQDDFKDIIANNKNLGRLEWISIIHECSEEAQKKEGKENPITEKTNTVELFKRILTQKAKQLKGFGPAKIKEATKLFKEYLK